MYDFATTVDLIASPDPGFDFVEWSGDVERVSDTASASTELVVFTDFVIQAVFAPQPNVPVPAMGLWGLRILRIALLGSAARVLSRAGARRGK